MDKFFGGLLMFVAIIVVLLIFFKIWGHDLAPSPVTSVESMGFYLDERNDLRFHNRLETS